MPLRRFFYLLLLVIVGAAGAWSWVQNRELARQLRGLEFARQRAAFFEAENARLVRVLAAKQQAESSDEDRRQIGAIEQTVADLSEWKFLHPVSFREIPRSELRRILSQKLTQQVPDQEFGNVGLELAALGLVPAGLDLKKTYLALLGEQVGAFYDQHTHELFTFSEHPLTNSQNRVVMAHELTHALQDQHFDLLKLPLEAKGNDDRALAASALVEGDATLVMNAYLTSNLSAGALRDTLTGAFGTDVRQLAAAPKYLRESLLFPYLQGQQFATALYTQGGRAAIAEAFRDPPASTAQILHPERYLSVPREEPMEIAYGETTVFNAKPAVDNVLGEFTIRQILAQWFNNKGQGNNLAAAWRGDRILVYGAPGAYSFVWQTAWRDAASALEYCRAAKSGLAVRYAAGNASRTLAISLPVGTESGDFSIAAGERRVRVICAGPRTLLIDAQDGRWADELARRFPLPASSGL